jgi:hypothetical protein
MFANGNPRHDFADTRDFSADPALKPAFSAAGFAPLDALDQLDNANAADSHLLRLVMCTACATLTLALVSSLA